MKLVLVAGVLAALGAPAAAAKLVYEAPAACPTEAQFVDAVAVHGGALGGADSGTGPALVVSIGEAGAGFSGAFQVRDAAGSSGKRQVSGRTCAEVADALAVVTAIASRPADAASAADPPPDATTDPAPAPDPAAAAANEVRPPEPPAASPVRPPPIRLRGNTRVFPPPRETVRVDAGDLRFDLAGTVTAAFGAAWGLVPSTVLPRYSLTFTTASFVTMPGGRQRINGLITS